MNSAHILLVEDEGIVAEVVQFILTGNGYKVTVVGDAESAWTFLKEGTPVDLILLDRGLPGMDGLTLLKWIKEDEDLKRLPVVLQTGQDDARSVREGLAAGAYYYLSKPPEPALLLAVVRGALKQERESALLQETLAETVRALRFLQEATFRFQTVAEARTLAQSLAWASPDPARMVLGLQELLINAVEHGNYGISYAAKSRLMVEDRWHQELARLAMDSVYGQRAVTVHLSRTASQLSLTIRDEGAGFDWTDYLDFSAERAFDLHGRGIAMARMTSFDFLEYQGNGNTVVARVNVPAAAARSHADLEC